MEQFPGLDGARRQEVSARLWTAWRAERRGGVILTGFSGTGKTDRVVRPLVDRALNERIPAVQVDVPQSSTDLDQELLALLSEGLLTNGYAQLAAELKVQPNFPLGLGTVLRRGALVVIDEFQRLLEPMSARPIDPLGGKLRQLAAPKPESGCLWLVSNREVDPGWAEPFHLAYLQPPEEVADALHIVSEGFGAEMGERLPTARQSEVVRRLGFNPRVLRLLGSLLRTYSLEELLGPQVVLPELPADSSLIDQVERMLLVKAREGLSPAASAALCDLSVLREQVPWAFVESMTTHLGNSRDLTRELRERFLLLVGSNRYRVHPVVREVEVPRLRLAEEAWRAAHQRAGAWYARPLLAMGGASLEDSGIALALSGARYHLAEAQAVDTLRDVVHAVRGYITRKYHWTAPLPTSAADRDARIDLLQLFLEQPGPEAAEYQLSKYLKQRADPGDLERALPHAKRATTGQDINEPWLLWAQLVKEVQGLEAGADAAKEATKHVSPQRSLHSIYQFLGACLDHCGQVEDAIAALLEGAEIVNSMGAAARLVEEAIFFAAAETRDDVLLRVRDCAQDHEGFEPATALCDVFLLERQGRWRDAALAAHQASDEYSTYLHLTMQEALAWLGAGVPASAQGALDRFPGGLRYEKRTGASWLAALVALHNGQLTKASELLGVYLGAAGPDTTDGIRASLLREWDHRVATVSEPNPALMAPILPPTVTGLAVNTMRPQYSPPVLPQHMSKTSVDAPPAARKLCVLAVATEWRSGNGGLSTLNRQFCCALAAAGAEVVCLVLNAPEVDRQAAVEVGVTLVQAVSTAGSTDLTAQLSRKPTLPPGFMPELIVGHGRVTGPAALAQLDHFPMAQRLHFIHMAPDEIEWFKPGREDDAGERAEERTRIELELGRSATRVVAVGPRLHQRCLTDFHPFEVATPIRLDPGFDSGHEAIRTPPPGTPIRVLVFGRMEDSELKGLDIAARAVGHAVTWREQIADPIELVVRGAQEGTSERVRQAVCDWAGVPDLLVVVRGYTDDIESLVLDLRRASLVLMPSRSEGFGLAGLEAIVAGTPVLLSDQSGIGALLTEVLEPEQASRFLVRMSGDDQDYEAWGRAVDAVLRDRDAAFRRAAELRTLLGKQKTWAAAIAGLLAELGQGRTMPFT